MSFVLSIHQQKVGRGKCILYLTLVVMLFQRKCFLRVHIYWCNGDWVDIWSISIQCISPYLMYTWLCDEKIGSTTKKWKSWCSWNIREKLGNVEQIAFCLVQFFARYIKGFNNIILCRYVGNMSLLSLTYRCTKCCPSTKLDTCIMERVLYYAR